MDHANHTAIGIIFDPWETMKMTPQKPNPGRRKKPLVPRPWISDEMKEFRLTEEQAARIADERRPNSSMPDRGRWIKRRLPRTGVSQVDLGYLIGSSQVEISRIISGKRIVIDDQIAEDIGAELRKPTEWVILGPAQPKMVRILGEMQGDEAIRLYPEEQCLELNGFTPDADTDGYRVLVDTLEPRWRLNDIILTRREGSLIQDCTGRDCVVEIDGTRYVGLVEVGASPRLVTLRRSRSGNPSLIDRTPTWISPIILTYHLFSPKED
jgi:hypothetical protein